MKLLYLLLMPFLALLHACSWQGKTNPVPDRNDSLTVTLIGRQSVWTAQYPGPDGHCGKIKFLVGHHSEIDPDDSTSADDFLTIDTLHLPEHSRVIFRFTSIDVIHSAYFPQMHLQTNAVPGMYTILHYPTPAVSSACYDLLCNRICGPRHFQMHTKVLIESRDRFEQWCKKTKHRTQDVRLKTLDMSPEDSDEI